MASHVQVILRDDVDNLGETGDLVRVRPGYARNFLIPRGMAVLATRGNIAQIEHEKKLALARAEDLAKEAKAVAGGIEGTKVQISKQAGEEGKLFGSVTAPEIAQALAEQGVEVDRKKIVMPDEPIKQVGTYELAVKLRGSVSAGFTVEVVAAE